MQIKHFNLALKAVSVMTFVSNTSQGFKQKVFLPMCAACAAAQLHLAASNRWHSSLLSSEKHVSSFIIQCNWTRLRVYRYLVQQQKQHAEKKKKSCQYCQSSHTWRFPAEKKVLGLFRNKRKYAPKKLLKSQGYVCACVCACTQELKRNKKQRLLPGKLHCKGIQIARKT